MNFLSMCKRVRQMSGVSGDGPASVVGQRGILLKIVDWVRDAEWEILTSHDDWKFLRNNGSINLVANQSDYAIDATSLGAINRIKQASINAQPLVIVEHEQWQNNYIQYTEGKTGIPQEITITSNQLIKVYPTPNADTSVIIDYFKLPVGMTENVDASQIPTRYELAITRKALMFYADHEEDIHLYQRSAIEYENWLSKLANDQLPKISFERGGLF